MAEQGSPVSVLLEQLASGLQQSDNDDVLTTLRELNLLWSDEGRWLGPADFASSIPAQQLVPCLESDSTEQVELACSLLDKFVRGSDADTLLQPSTHDAFVQGLKHGVASVRRLCVRAIHKLASTEASKELFWVMLPMLADEDLGVANAAAAYIKEGSQDPKDSTCSLLSDRGREELRNLCKDDITRFRVYALLIDVLDDEKLDADAATSASSMLQPLVQSITSAVDPLLAMNALELFAKMASSDSGLVLLKQHHVVEAVVTLLRQSEDPVSDLLKPSLLAFLAEVAVLHSDFAADVQRQHDILGIGSKLFLQDSNQTIKHAALDFLSRVGYSHPTILELLSSGPVPEALAAATLSGASEDLQPHALHSVGRLLLHSTDYSELARQLFARMAGGDLGPKLVALAQKPFNDVRCAALFALKGLASHVWGTELLFSLAGFAEYALDRSTEQVLDTVYLKFAIVEKMTHNMPQSLDSALAIKFRLHVRQGVHYRQAQAEVAMEDVAA